MARTQFDPIEREVWERVNALIDKGDDASLLEAFLLAKGEVLASRCFDSNDRADKEFVWRTLARLRPILTERKFFQKV